jgi:hypothetical protein
LLDREIMMTPSLYFEWCKWSIKILN